MRLYATGSRHTSLRKSRSDHEPLQEESADMRLHDRRAMNRRRGGQATETGRPASRPFGRISSVRKFQCRSKSFFRQPERQCASGLDYFLKSLVTALGTLDPGVTLCVTPWVRTPRWHTRGVHVNRRLHHLLAAPSIIILFALLNARQKPGNTPYSIVSIVRSVHPKRRATETPHGSQV